MKISKIFLSLFAAVFTISNLSAEEPLKVACVGNSITFGYTLPDREHDSYPSVLGRMLGDGYEVHNYGICSKTMIDNGIDSYMKEQYYADAQALNPDIVTIKLGTNDSKAVVWQYKQQFSGDLEKMLAAFESLPSKPRIYLCYPVPAFSHNWGITDSVIYNHIIPLIGQAAKKHNITVIDLYSALKPHGDLFHDGIHPNEKGAAIIAEEIYKVIADKR